MRSAAPPLRGMGFAIPINTAKDIVDELIPERLRFRPSVHRHHPARTSSPRTAKVSGVQVYSIDSRAKAASEGLQVGDVITAVDGYPDPGHG